MTWAAFMRFLLRRIHSIAGYADETISVSESDLSKPRIAPAAGMAIALNAVALLGRAVFIGQPVNSDTAMFVYMGKLVSHGGRMGVDLIDNKLPSVGLLMSAPYRLL